jgi:hypothetical protein
MMAMVYKWKAHASFGVAAQVAGEELERLRGSKNTPLIAADVVKAARSPKSPLHPAFEWDDKKAAHHYRLDQAGQLIRSVIVTVVDGKPQAAPVRAFVSVGQGEERGYTSVSVAMGDEVMRAQVIARAWKELEDWRKRYEDLLEFSKLFDVIDEVHEKIPQAA